MTKMFQLASLKLNPRNPRTITGPRFAALVKSIKDFPRMMELRPIIVDGDGMILGGNMRFRALKELGYKEVPVAWVKRAEELTPSEVRRFIVMDNEGFGQWDDDILAADFDIGEIGEWGVDLERMGLVDLGGDDVDAEPQIDKAAELNKAWQVNPGDLWRIGEHRLLCGDSTRAQDVALVLGDNKPLLMVTDPPYGVELDQSWRDDALGAKAMGPGNKRKVDNDDRADWTEVWALFPGDVAYVWHASKFSDVVMASLRTAGFEICQQLIWNKSIMVMGRSDYHFKHEPCWYAVRKGKTHGWIGDRKQTTVIEAKSPNHIMSGSDEVQTEHPTQKPAECMSYLIRNHGGDCYDPFFGSGTTMVACENLGRKCYGIEISPDYCAVILQRMTDAFPGIEIKKLA